MKLNENEKKVLICLQSIWQDEANCMYFRGISEDTKLEIKQVRRACRSLLKKGLTEYIRGLFDEDGMVAGSGYCCTDAGNKVVQEINPPKLI